MARENLEIEFIKWEYFLTVAKTLNFSKAANELCITPQALTQQIKKFEDILGKKLFIRSTRNVELTEFGEYCVHRMQPVKDDYDRALEKIKNRIELSDKKLRIVFFRALPKERILNVWIEKIQNYFKGYEIDFIAANIEDVCFYLENGKADVGFTIVDQDLPAETYMTKKIESYPGKIFVSQKHIWLSRKNVTAEDISMEKMIQLDHAGHTWDSKNSVYAKIKCNGIRTTDNFDSMLMCLQKGDCFAVFPDIYNEKKDLHLKSLPLPKEYACIFNIVCIAKKDLGDDRFVNLMEYLNSCC